MRRVSPIDKEVSPLQHLNIIAKVTFGGELFLRGEVEKRGYKGQLFKALPGDLIISKIRVGQGSFCVIGGGLDHVAVSPEYPVYTPDPDRVDPDYLVLVLRTPEFLAQLTGSATGNTTKRRIRPIFFESRHVPLPPLERQRVIAAAHRAALERAAELEGEADELERQAMAAFEAALGFEPPAPQPDRPVFIASFKDLDRWSHEAVLRATTQEKNTEPKFPLVELAAIGRVSYGLQKSPANRPDTSPRPYLRVANVQRWRLNLDEIRLIDVLDRDMPAYRLEDGDILLCEGNSPELVGRGAIWQCEIANCVHQNHILRVRMDASRALPEFTLAAINSTHGQAYFRSKAKHTTNLASINSKEVSQFPLPLPPVEQQRVLVDTLFDGQRKAEDLRRQAADIRTAAWTGFEASVYAGEDSVANTETKL